MSDAPRNAANAPPGPILVWVRDTNIDGKPVGWRMGRVAPAIGAAIPAELQADGYNGDWDIPFWHPLPPPPTDTK